MRSAALREWWVNLQDSSGRCALHHAASLGDPSLVQSLLDAKADVITRDDLDRTALHCVFARELPGGQTAPVVTKLLLAGVDAQAVDVDGMTASDVLELADSGDWDHSVLNMLPSPVQRDRETKDETSDSPFFWICCLAVLCMALIAASP